jgi:hypothetical protein
MGRIVGCGAACGHRYGLLKRARSTAGAQCWGELAGLRHPGAAGGIRVREQGEATGLVCRRRGCPNRRWTGRIVDCRTACGRRYAPLERACSTVEAQGRGELAREYAEEVFRRCLAFNRTPRLWSQCATFRLAAKSATHRSDWNQSGRTTTTRRGGRPGPSEGHANRPSCKRGGSDS